MKLFFFIFRLPDNATIQWRDVVRPSLLRVNQNYSFYYLGVAKIILLGIFPLSALVYLNIKIYKGLKFPPSLIKENDEIQSSLEKDWAKVLIGIVIIFVMCHAFRVVIEIDNMFGSETVELCYRAGKYTYTLWSIIVDPLSEVMMVFNSSLNMLIYTCLSKSFRRHLVLCCRNESSKPHNTRVVNSRGAPLHNRSSFLSITERTNMMMSDIGATKR